MRSAALSECIDVILEPFSTRVDALCSHCCLQFLCIVDTLSTTHNLLTSHEKVVRIGKIRIGWMNLGVKGSHSHGKLVKDVEVSVVLFSNDLAELLFHCCG